MPPPRSLHLNEQHRTTLPKHRNNHRLRKLGLYLLRERRLTLLERLYLTHKPLQQIISLVLHRRNHMPPRKLPSQLDSPPMPITHASAGNL